MSTTKKPRPEIGQINASDEIARRLRAFLMDEFQRKTGSIPIAVVAALFDEFVTCLCIGAQTEEDAFYALDSAHAIACGQIHNAFRKKKAQP